VSIAVVPIASVDQPRRSVSSYGESCGGEA
jgi:hypothetical protein